MAQGLAIEPLLAAYQLNGDVKFVEGAKLAANALAVPIEAGGVAVYLERGIWFEEYAGAIGPPITMTFTSGGPAAAYVTLHCVLRRRRQS